MRNSVELCDAFVYHITVDKYALYSHGAPQHNYHFELGLVNSQL